MRPVGVGPRPGVPGAGRASRVAGLWVALGILCYLIFGLQLMDHAGPDTLPDPAKYSSVQLKLMGRYVIGAKSWGMSLEGISPQIDDLADANVIDRLRAAVVISEILGPTEGLHRLDHLDPLLADMGDEEGVAGLQEDSALLRRAFTLAAATTPPEPPATEAPAESAGAESASSAEQPIASPLPEPLTEAERQRLVDRHGWFGRLTLAQDPGADPAIRAEIVSGGVRAMIALLCFAIIGGGAILIGLALFIIAMVMVGSGRVRTRYAQTRAHFTAPTSAFLETTVLFLGLFIGIQIVAGLIGLIVDIESVAKPMSLILMWLVALIAFWPLARGVSFSQLRAAYGWHAGGDGFAGVVREVGMGVVGYLAGLPIVIGGVLLTVLLMALTSSETTHPIQGEVEVRSLTDAIYLYVLAAIWAPLVEETIFRGAMFHSLRQWTGLLASAFATAFVFAIIHPQGYAGVPVLMALAINFAIMREWRGSLIPSITAHALHNGTLITMLVVILA
jgi:membrane protease YdiL (CAAX protease family)